MLPPVTELDAGTPLPLLTLPMENPTLEIEVRREEGPEVSAPVEETVWAGDSGGDSYEYLPPRFKSGISVEV
jgi:hypothetical protein